MHTYIIIILFLRTLISVSMF